MPSSSRRSPRITAGSVRPWHDERREDHAEREVDDERALRERVSAGVDRERQRERGGERDGSAQAGPADQRPGTATAGTGSRSRMRFDMRLGMYVAGKIQTMRVTITARLTIAPSAMQRSRRAPVQRVEDRPQLQPDEAEQQRVEQEREDLPDRVALQPRLHGRQLGRVPAHVDRRP